MVTEISKRTRNGINARIEAIVKKYGFEDFRRVDNKYINTVREKNKLQKEIAQRERELENLKKGKKC